MSSDVAQHFIQTLQQVEAAQVVDPPIELFAEDVELMNLAMSEPLRGHEDARRFWEKYLSVFAQIHSYFTHVIESQAAVILEWTSQGTLTNQEPFSYRGVSILETKNGQICRFRTYYDAAAFLPQGSNHAS